MTGRMDVSSHKIMSMNEDKRAKLINAALNEFRGGYKRASTDNIVREAGISKGLLYHYFGTKEKLYEFLIWYAADLVISKFSALEDKEDLLERIWRITLLKIEMCYKMPAIFEFLASAYSGAKEEGGSELMQVFAKIRDSLVPVALGSIDRSLFKEGIDPDKAVQIIWWSLSSYSESHIHSGKAVEDYQKDFETNIAELREYLDLFRRVFYKE